MNKFLKEFKDRGFFYQCTSEYELSNLLDKENIQRESIERHGSVWQVPTWNIKNQKIWGLTAMITVNFLNVCFDANIEILEGKLK